uniref:TIR domain-containing protein n=1 Tax=Xiphophorus couchianus TaxID=32473 RepID=A0A3B5LJJ5_9TELE
VLLTCPETSSLYFYYIFNKIYSHQGEADTYHVSAGHLFLLSCQIADAHSEIKWSRGDGGDGSLPAGVEVRDGSLWFLPVQMTHSGSYVCEKRLDNTYTFINRSWTGWKILTGISSTEVFSFSRNTFYMIVSLWLSALFTILILTAFVLVCKVNLFLAYRALKTVFSKQDGKLYDAYVSVGQSAMLSLDGVACFALRVLPEELEQKHGYSLYIRGRDDRPGEAIHDVISAAVRQCRRLLIVLSSAGKSKETAQFWENPNQLTYEQKVGLHDALMRNDPKVILVEVDGPVDYSQLPESLRYIKRTQGALEWKSSFVETNKLTQMYLKSNFWKSLRRHMPAAPARRPQSIA